MRGLCSDFSWFVNNAIEERVFTLQYSSSLQAATTDIISFDLKDKLCASQSIRWIFGSYVLNCLSQSVGHERAKLRGGHYKVKTCYSTFCTLEIDMTLTISGTVFILMHGINPTVTSAENRPCHMIHPWQLKATFTCHICKMNTL